MYFNVGNLGGTLYRSEQPLCTFKFDRGMLISDSIQVHFIDPFFWPLQIQDPTVENDWLKFFESQIVPRSRYRIVEDLQLTGIFTDYVEEQILRYTKCRNVANHFWVDCDDDLSCWSEAQIEELRRRNIL